jgi:3-oxoadipate enol-lactonase
MIPIASTSGLAQVYNGQLYFEVAGSGPPVLLIHAGVADCTMWDDQFSFFSQSYRVIRYDMRGFGKSHSDTTEFSNRQDILDLFNLLGVDKACLIGISRGSMIAIDFTLEHPDCVSALIPVSPGIGGYEYRARDSEKDRQEIALFNRMQDLWEKKAYNELTDLEVHVWADGPSQPVGRAPAKIRENMRKIVMANLTRQDGEATPQPLTPPAVNRLSEIQVPTLILVGDYDSVDTIDAADKLVKEIPNARKVLFQGAAHMIPLEQPAKFNQAVLEFLKLE